MTRSTRKAYSLFQLLLLLAVLLVLLGMFLPALMQMRMAAARAQTQNNLKQIGLGMHNYHDTQNKLPSGVDDKNFSGLAKILPFIEQDNLFKNLDFTQNAESNANAAVRQVRIKVFESNRDPVEQPVAKVGPTSYQLVAGSKLALEDNDGIFYRNSDVQLQTIADGTSNTIMAIEALKGDGQKKAESVARQHVRLKKAELKNLKEESGVKDFENNKNIASNRGSSWIDGRFLQATTTITREFNSTRPDVDCEGAGGLAAPRSLEKGTSVLFGDGSVRFLTDKVHFVTLQGIATRAGGEVVTID